VPQINPINWLLLFMYFCSIFIVRIVKINFLIGGVSISTGEVKAVKRVDLFKQLI